LDSKRSITTYRSAIFDPAGSMTWCYRK